MGGLETLVGDVAGVERLHALANHDDWLAWLREDGNQARTATATLAGEPDQADLTSPPAAGSSLANTFHHDAWLPWLPWLSEGDDNQSWTTATLTGVPDQPADRINPLAGVSRNLPTAPTGPNNAIGYVCTHPGCNWTKPFKRKADLERHGRKHRLPELDCAVDGCDRKGPRGFRRQDKLRVHQRTKHAMTI